MPGEFFGGLDFGTSGVRISIINLKKDLKYSNSVDYEYSFKNPKCWVKSCEKLLSNLPFDIKQNIVNLAISGTSGTLIACNLNGDPIGKAIPYDQACNENKLLIESITFGEDHLQTPYSSCLLYTSPSPRDDR